MLLNDYHKSILDKYKIPYQDIDLDIDEIEDLFVLINNYMIDFVDENDEPLAEFLELQDLYDDIYTKY